MKIEIRTSQDCDDLEALAFLILSAVGARRRWLRWEREAPQLCGAKQRQARMRMQMAMAKTFEDAEHYERRLEEVRDRLGVCR